MTADGMVLEGFAGPGGWSQALRMLRLSGVGIELDATACATRAAAGHLTVCADMSRFPVSQLADLARGQVHSPPCVTFSAAGSRAGVLLQRILADLIRDLLAGRATRAAHRKAMAATLRRSGWLAGGPATQMDAYTWRRYEQQAWKRRLLARKNSHAARLRAMAPRGGGPHLRRAERSAKIWQAVRSASLVAEPARFIRAAPPEWIAMEQVPAVLPLFEVYADELRKMGYSAWTGKLNAADYGVPQTRIRVILIASRARRVSRPLPTHYDPGKGDQMFGERWVSMADALGWGATSRPVPAVTAGGTAAGGAEPFPTRAREILAAEQNAGRWILHTNRGQDEAGCRQTRDPRLAPAPALTSKSGGQWVLVKDAQANAAVRPAPAPAPAPTISFGHAAGEMRWKFRNNNACTRSLDEPAGTPFFGGRPDWAAWVTERPATTAQGDPRVGRPGHKDRDRGESQFAQDSVRITVEEAAALQSFPPGYPFQGNQGERFRQVGDAVPPLLAMHVIAEATGIRQEIAA